jgi:tetratricopeptide (TPR) repeat protein
LKNGDQRDKKNTLLPMGYDAFFRAVGTRLDRRGAVGITICETAGSIYVSYWVDKATFVIREGRRQPVSSVQLEIYDANGAKALIQSTNETLGQEMDRYRRGLSINAYDYLSMQDAAFLFEDEGDYREAELLFNRIAAGVPEHPEVHYHIARLEFARGDKRGALSSIKKAVAVNPHDPAVHDLHGRILSEHGKLKDAIAAFQQAVELDMDNGIQHFHLSKAYEAAGRSDEALTEMELSTSLTAAPAWDMLQEDIAIEIHPTAPGSVLPLMPSESALLPPMVDLTPVDSKYPTMTTSFEPSDGVWPSLAPEHKETIADSPAMPQLTPFGQTPPMSSVREPDSAPAQALTLEQRLRAARAAPIMQAPPAETAIAAPPMPADSASHSGPQLVAAPFPSSDTQQDAPLPGAQQFQSAAAPVREVSTNANAVELAAEVLTIRRAIEAEPNRADLHRKLGFMLARQGKTAEAATEFRKALQASRTTL